MFHALQSPWANRGSGSRRGRILKGSYGAIRTVTPAALTFTRLSASVPASQNPDRFDIIPKPSDHEQTNLPQNALDHLHKPSRRSPLRLDGEAEADQLGRQHKLQYGPAARGRLGRADPVLSAVA